MKTKVLIVLLIISLGFNIGIVLNFIIKSRGTEPVECGWHHTNLRERFKLNPEQIQTLEKKRTEMETKILPIRKRLQNYRLELLALQKAEKIDTLRLDSLLWSIARAQCEIEKNIIMHIYEVRGIFNETQLQEFYQQLENNLCPGQGHRLYPECERR